MCRAAIPASSPTAAPQPADAYQRLKGLKVLRSTDGQSVELVEQWGSGKPFLVTWTRSLGCPFCQEHATQVSLATNSSLRAGQVTKVNAQHAASSGTGCFCHRSSLASAFWHHRLLPFPTPAHLLQLARDVKPKLDAAGVGLLMVTIGTPERSKDFVARTGFPAECLLLDPDNVTYDALGLRRNIQDMLFNIATPLSLVKRATSGKGQDLMKVLDGWEPWTTPRGVYQAMQQGGAFVFEGELLLWSYIDPATAAHAEVSQLLSVLESIAAAQAQDCGCDTAGTAGNAGST